MRVPLTGIYIQGEGFRRVSCRGDFAQILEEKLGQDAADMFKQLVPNPKECCGECDALDDMRRDYERAIEDALGMLDCVKPKDRASRSELEDAKIVLREVLT